MGWGVREWLVTKFQFHLLVTNVTPLKCLKNKKRCPNKDVVWFLRTRKTGVLWGEGLEPERKIPSATDQANPYGEMVYDRQEVNQIWDQMYQETAVRVDGPIIY